MKHVIEANAARAQPTQLAKALAVLTAVCAKPADFDDAKVVLWSERLKQVLQEFPGDIALAAISEWPQSDGGKWWPTEKELRDECTHRMRFREQLIWWLEHQAGIARSAEMTVPAEHIKDGMESEPIDERVRRYVRRLSERSPDVARTYLAAARYGHGTIGLHGPMAMYSLERHAPGLIDECGVKILSPRAYDAAGIVVAWS